MPLAVEIPPAHRVPGDENYATFQPTFLSECGWDLLVGVLVIWAARRFLLAGDRAFAGCLAGLAEPAAVPLVPGTARQPSSSTSQAFQHRG